jgi:hypothetical protein
LERQTWDLSQRSPEISPDAPHSTLDSAGKFDLELISSAASGNLTHDGKTIHGIRSAIRLKFELQSMSGNELIDLTSLVSILGFWDDESRSLLQKIYGNLFHGDLETKTTAIGR